MGFPFQDRFNRIGGGDIALQIRERAEAGRVQLPFYYYDILADGSPVGKISIRIGDNFHTYYNGHIGYEVDEGARGTAMPAGPASWCWTWPGSTG